MYKLPQLENLYSLYNILGMASKSSSVFHESRTSSAEKVTNYLIEHKSGYKTEFLHSKLLIHPVNK